MLEGTTRSVELHLGRILVHRLSVRFEGRVQGVGFRATVADAARSFALTGRVRNVHDGTVDLQAEGEEIELVRFRQAIGQKMDRYIVNAHERWSQVAEAEWRDFAIGVDLER